MGLIPLMETLHSILRFRGMEIANHAFRMGETGQPEQRVRSQYLYENMQMAYNCMDGKAWLHWAFFIKAYYVRKGKGVPQDI